MKTKTIKNLLVISAVAAVAITVPAIAITTINSNNNINQNSDSGVTNLNTSQINYSNTTSSEFALNNKETISKYNASNSNIPSSNISDIASIANNITITVPSDLTIAAWKAAAYNDGINGTLQGAHINANGNVGGLQFLLNNEAWNGTPFITWSYSANMSTTTIETPQPSGQNFIYIRVFPSGSNAWFGVKVTGFAASKTISKYNTDSNIPSSNISDIASIANNMTITVPSDLTIAAWKIAAYNDGINGTLQGAHINANGNVGGLQFLLNNEAWNGTPFITWSYSANMSTTTIQTSQPEGQNFIYIRVFPSGSNAWFGVKVTGFASSVQNNNLSANSLVSAIPNELLSNSAAANFYALQVNNINVSSLLDNLPQLPSGFNYIYSISNNNSASAISNGTLTLNIEVYDASTNTTSFSRTFTLNGFKQGDLINPYFTTGTPVLSNISVVVAKDTSIYTLSSASSDYISNLTQSVSNMLINGQITPDISIFQTSTGQSLPNGDGILFGLSTDLYSQANTVGINTTTMYLKLQNLEGSSAVYQINNLEYTAWFLQSIANKINISNLKTNSIIENVNPKNVNQSNVSSFVTFDSNSMPFTKDITYNIQLQSVNVNTGQITVSVMVGYSVGAAQSIFITIPGFMTQSQQNEQKAAISKSLNKLTINNSGANLYALQANNNNVGSLLNNLPQLPNGLTYVYSVNNNNSALAISNGTISLNVEVYQASTNTTILSQTITLSGFKQGVLVNPYFTVGTPILSNNISVVVAKNASIYTLSLDSNDYISNLTQSVNNKLIDGQITPDISIFQTSTGQSLPNEDGILFGLSTDLYSKANNVGISTTTMYLKLQDLQGSSAIYQINNLEYTGWFLQSIANGITKANINLSSTIKNVSPDAITQANLSSYVTLNNDSLTFYKGITYNIELQSVNANTGQITISVIVRYSDGAGRVYITIPGFLSKTQELINQGTVSKYNPALTNIAINNTNNVDAFYNNVSVVVPKGLTIAAWKALAFKNGINGTKQGAHISSNGNVGGIQFLLKNSIWNGRPFMTWSYSANMSPTTISTQQPTGQNFIYIRIFPSSGGWFGIKVNGFTPSAPIDTNITASLPTNIAVNSAATNFYALQVNNTNVSSLLANLPQLSSGFNYIYSVSNNNSTSAISNGSITLNVQIYDASANKVIASQTYTVSGFRQGTVVNPYFTVGTPILSNNITVVVAKNASIYTISSASSDYISNLTQSVNNMLIDGQITPDISIFQTSTGQSLPNGDGILFGLSTDLYSQANEVGINTTTMYLKLQDLQGSSAIYQINNLEYTGWFLQSIANGITKANINVSSNIANVSPNTITQANLSSYVTFDINSLPFNKGLTYNIQLQSVNANTGEITISVMVNYLDGSGQSAYITIPGFLSKTAQDKKMLDTFSNIFKTIF